MFLPGSKVARVSCLACVIGSMSFASGSDSYPSPNAEFQLRYEVGPVVEAFNESSQTATLKFQNNVCWTYTSVARGFSFSWAPDSSGFLFGITHITRSMFLYYVHLGEGGDVYPISIELHSIEKQISASLPPRQGASAPKAGIDFNKVKWVTPKQCQVLFSQSFLGENADSILEIDLENPFKPSVKVISTEAR